MKKLSSIFFMVLLVLVLSGCDLIGQETIDKATEELCRDNPDNALCQTDALADLEETVILDLFKDLLASNGNSDADAYCDQFISVTNVELLDSCRADIASLFPEDIDNYEVISVTTEGDSYVITLQNKTDAEKLNFIVKTKTDGTTVQISELSYGPVYVLEPGVLKADILSLIEQLVSDLENPILSDEEVCALWDGIDQDCDGIEDARRKFKAGADLAKTINILDPDDDDDGLLYAEVSFTDNGHVTVLKISFNIDNTGEVLVLTAIDPDSDSDGFGDMIEGIEKTEIKRIIELFIADLIDPTITDLGVCEIWYDGLDDDCDGIAEDRLKFKAGAELAKEINIIDDDTDGDGLLDVEVSFIFNGHVTVLKIAIQIDTTAADLKLIVLETEVNEGLEVYLTAEEALALFNEFVIDYLDPTISADDLNMMYFNNEMDAQFGAERQMDIEEGLIVNVVTTTPPLMNEEGYFIIEVEFVRDGITMYEEINIKPIRLDLAIIINFGEDDNYEEEIYDLLEIEALWNDFVEDYLDPTVLFEDLNMMYFNGMLDTEFMDQRTNDLARGITITTVSVMYSNPYPDSFFDIELEINDSGSIQNERIKVRVNRIDMALYFSFDNYGNVDVIPYEEALLVLQNYQDHYNHMSMDSNSFCSTTVIDFQVERCQVERDEMVSNGFTMTGFELYEMDYQYMVDFYYEDTLGNQILETKMVYFIMDDTENYLLEFYDNYMVEIDNLEVDLLLENFFSDIGDTSILTTNVCHFFADDVKDDDCDGLVTRIREGGYTIGSGTVEDLGNIYIVEILFTSESETFSEMYEFYFYYDSDGVLKAQMYMMHMDMEIFNETLMLFEGLYDFTIPVEEVCSTNLHSDAYLRCVAIRDYHFNNDYYMIISEMYVDMDMNNVVVVITYDNMGMFVEENVFVVYYMTNTAGENILYLESTTEGNNPLYN